MKLRDIFNDKGTKIFRLTGCYSGDELDWDIVPTDLDIFPSFRDDETYFVSVLHLYEGKEERCFLDIQNPEGLTLRIIKFETNGIPKIESYIKNYVAPNEKLIPAFSVREINSSLYFTDPEPILGINFLIREFERDRTNQFTPLNILELSKWLSDLWYINESFYGVSYLLKRDLHLTASMEHLMKIKNQIEKVLNENPFKDEETTVFSYFFRNCSDPFLRFAHGNHPTWEDLISEFNSVLLKIKILLNNK